MDPLESMIFPTRTFRFCAELVRPTVAIVSSVFQFRFTSAALRIEQNSLVDTHLDYIQSVLEFETLWMVSVCGQMDG